MSRSRPARRRPNKGSNNRAPHSRAASPHHPRHAYHQNRTCRLEGTQHDGHCYGSSAEGIQSRRTVRRGTWRMKGLIPAQGQRHDRHAVEVFHSLRHQITTGKRRSIVAGSIARHRRPSISTPHITNRAVDECGAGLRTLLRDFCRAKRSSPSMERPGRPVRDVINHLPPHQKGAAQKRRNSCSIFRPRPKADGTEQEQMPCQHDERRQNSTTSSATLHGDVKRAGTGMAVTAPRGRAHRRTR